MIYNLFPKFQMRHYMASASHIIFVGISAKNRLYISYYGKIWYFFPNCKNVVLQHRIGIIWPRLTFLKSSNSRF